MTAAELPDDQTLLTRLGEIARQLDPPPPIAYDLGRAAFTLRRLDAEFAELVADSHWEAAAVRGPAPGFRLLSFHTGGLSVEVQVSGSGPGSAVLGDVAWAGVDALTIALETTAGDRTPIDVDPDGRFEFAPAPRAVMRFRVEATDGRSATTSWVKL